MAFVVGRFQPADLLLGGFQFACKFGLREAGLFAQCGELQGDVPSLAGLLEARGEGRVAQPCLEISRCPRSILASSLSSRMVTDPATAPLSARTMNAARVSRGGGL